MTPDYILFSHLYEKTLKELRDPDKTWVRDLVQLLQKPHAPGMAVLFYHSGWQDLVRGTLLGKASHQSVTVARQAQTLAQQVEAAARRFSADGKNPLRIVTALDLLPLIKEIANSNPTVSPIKLANFLGTNFAGSRYDFPKLVESFLRLRNPSCIPVLRIDQDVLFNDAVDPRIASNGLTSPIQMMVNRCQHLLSRSDGEPFLISGQYLTSTGTRPTSTWTPSDWLSNFATRPFPALMIDDAEEPRFEEATLRAYYGIDATGSQLELTSDGLPQGIASLGAPPLNSPISGALMMLSQPAVAMTPPFCNFRTNVVWIDDYLNYAMHRELARSTDLKPSFNCQTSPLYAECNVVKARPTISEAREYARTAYLPALVRGCIVDAWIQPDIRTKTEPRYTAPIGAFIRYLTAAQQAGCLAPESAQQCRENLKQAAWLRLQEVRDQWSRLPNETPYPTLAAEWIAEGDLVSKVELEILLDDTLEYIEWAVAWPGVVDTVRIAHPGTLHIDLPA